MAYSQNDWVIICLCVLLPVLLAVAIYGARLGWKSTDATLSDFVVAKKRFEYAYIAPAFLFAGLGSGVIDKPGAYAANAGVLGLCMYAVWAGLSVLIIALLGKWIRGAVDGAESISDFVMARFGQLAELYISCLVLFNTSVLLINEYSNIRTIFISYVQTKGYAVVLIIGSTALLYVALGGLKSVIQVHPVQAVLVAICAVMIASYVGAKFSRKLPSNLSDVQRGYSPAGYSSIILQPIVLISTAFFNEALWQKCWAAKGEKDLTLGAFLAGLLIFGFIFASGYLSLAAQWTGLVPDGEVLTNYFFHVFETSTRKAVLHNWIGIVVMLAAALFSQGAAAALQNAITNTLSAYMFRTQPVHTAKFICFVLNVPIIAVACTGYDTFPKLLRFSSLLCSTTVFPVVAGTLLLMVELYTGDMMLYSSVLSIIGVSMYGIYGNYSAAKPASTIQLGLSTCWWTTTYNWKFFIVAFMSSVLAVVVCIVLGLLLGMLKWKWLTHLSPTANYTKLTNNFINRGGGGGVGGGGGGNGGKKAAKK